MFNNSSSYTKKAIMPHTSLPGHKLLFGVNHCFSCSLLGWWKSEKCLLTWLSGSPEQSLDHKQPFDTKDPRKPFPKETKTAYCLLHIALLLPAVMHSFYRVKLVKNNCKIQQYLISITITSNPIVAQCI